VIDEYCNFYLQWIEPLKKKGIEGGKGYWQSKRKTSAANAWSGYAFENICLKHIDEIKNALDIQNIACESGSFRCTFQKNPQKTGAQIDLLFDREDGVITLCEIKYSEKPFLIDKVYSKELMNKIDAFEKHFLSSKQKFLAMITTMGIKKNVWSNELVQDEVKLSDLF
jgi:uncharacterized protein